MWIERDRKHEEIACKEIEIDFSEIGEDQSNFKMTRSENAKDGEDSLWIS